MKDHCTTGLQFNKTGTDQKEQMLFFVCSEAGESKLVKLETSRTVILPTNNECSLVKFTTTNIQIPTLNKRIY